jgi:hypothetical protein
MRACFEQWTTSHSNPVSRAATCPAAADRLTRPSPRRNAARAGVARRHHLQAVEIERPRVVVWLRQPLPRLNPASELAGEARRSLRPPTPQSWPIPSQNWRTPSTPVLSPSGWKPRRRRISGWRNHDITPRSTRGRPTADGSLNSAQHASAWSANVASSSESSIWQRFYVSDHSIYSCVIYACLLCDISSPLENRRSGRALGKSAFHGQGSSRIVSLKLDTL